MNFTILLLALALASGACSACQRPSRPVAPEQQDGRNAQGMAPVGEPAENADMETSCCAQCVDAASRDPAGRDIRMESCLRYKGEFGGLMGVDDRCVAFFERSPRRLEECWKVVPRK
ncbi:MAG: hypothetical protein HY698_01480 [Deltaproteobacteria bacterium]|nr:hypothetical protein [Deltaproteobacteria bacterium]